MVSAGSAAGRAPHAQYGTLAPDPDHDGSGPRKSFDGSHRYLNPDEHRPEHTDKSFMGAWLTLPYFRWYPRWYFITIRGAEWFHVYLWVAKDLAWTQVTFSSPTCRALL